MKISKFLAATAVAATFALTAPSAIHAQDKPKPKDEKPAVKVPGEKPAARRMDGSNATPLDSARRGAEGEAARGRELRSQSSRGEAVELSAISQAAQDSFAKIFTSGPPTKIERFKVGNSVIFAAEEEGTDQLRQARVLEDGTILEVGTKATTIPPAVQQYIDQRFRGSDTVVHEMTLTYYEIERPGERGRNTSRVTGAGQPLGFGGLLNSAAPNIPRPQQADTNIEEAEKKMKEKQEKIRKAKEEAEGMTATKDTGKKTP